MAMSTALPDEEATKENNIDYKIRERKVDGDVPFMGERKATKKI